MLAVSPAVQTRIISNLEFLEREIEDWLEWFHNDGINNNGDEHIGLQALFHFNYPHISRDKRIAQIANPTEYIKCIITYGIRGLDDYVANEIWEKYYVRNWQLSRVANFLNYSISHIYIIKQTIPKRVTFQLWKKNEEIKNWHQHKNIFRHPLTIEQRQARYLKKAFAIKGDRQIAVLIIYCYLGGAATRQKVAEILEISENTVKTRVSQILSTMHLENMKQATDVAKDFLIGCRLWKRE